MSIEKLEREYNIKVEYVNFPLHPDTPAQGISIVDLFGGQSALPRIEASQKRMKALTAAEGLPMADRTMVYNSRLAQELGVWAAAQGKGPEFHQAAFRAYFAEARNISDPEVLVALAEGVGLDGAQARKVLTERLYKSEVDSEWSASEAAGVNAVPTFEAGGTRVVGAQPYEVLAQLVEKAGATRRSTPSGTSAQ